jgi:hypothetical protein
MALDASLIGVALRDMIDQRATLAREATAAHRYVGQIGFRGKAKQLLADLNEFCRGRPESYARGWDAERGWQLGAQDRARFAQGRIRGRVHESWPRQRPASRDHDRPAGACGRG